MSPTIVVFTGAGISAESGVPTFRGSGGTWEGHSIDQVCNAYSWKRNAPIVHEFYNRRRLALKDVKHNRAHKYVSDWQHKHGAKIITQNIDLLHEQSGADDVLHVHGRATDMKCEACGNVWDIGYAEWSYEADRCAKCGSKRGVRPGIVFFNDPAPNYRILYKAISNLKKDDILIVIGTSGTVIDIAKIAEFQACKKILNNLEPDLHNPTSMNVRLFDHVIYGPATEAVVSIDEIIQAHLNGG